MEKLTFQGGQLTACIRTNREKHASRRISGDEVGLFLANSGMNPASNSRASRSRKRG